MIYQFFSRFRKWETLEGKESKPISIARWQLMLIKAGIVTVEPLDISS